MNQRTHIEVERARYPLEQYDALSNRVSGIHGRESLAVRQMVRDAVVVRGIDPKCIQLADAIVTWQMDPLESFAIAGETRATNWQFNTLTVVYGISAGVRSATEADNVDLWFFDIQRSQRNAIAQPDNRANFSAISTEGITDYTAIQPMYGEYKVDWTGTVQLDERVTFPQVIQRFTINLHGVEVWQRNGPILGR